MNLIHKYILLTAVILFSCAHSLPAQNVDEENSLLWKISGNGLENPSYLFGTFHTLDSTIFQEKDLVMEKLYGCVQFAMEDTIGGSDLDGEEMVASMVMLDKTLEELLDPSSYEMLSGFLVDSIGLEISYAKYFKPIVISLIITVWEDNPQYISGEGKENPAYITLDDYMKVKSEEKGLKVIALENSTEFMSILFDYYTLEEQAEILMEQVRQIIEGSNEEYDMLFSNYNDENLDVIFSSSLSSMPKGLFDIFVTQRNELWLSKLPGIISKGQTFIAVGALHLPGDVGLIEGLKKAGYTLTPLKTSNN